MQKYLSFLVAILLIASFSCSKENPDESPIPVKPKLNKGVFLDSPVYGLTYVSKSASGTTDEKGTFNYVSGERVSFKVGRVVLGEVVGKDIVTPVDLVSGGNINTSKVRNIASFLQSIDNDGDASNGIHITAEVNNAFSNVNIDFSSENFLPKLKEIIDKVNVSNKLSLKLVHPNDAAIHLASNLKGNEVAKIFPAVLVGKHWENGNYYFYNTYTYKDEKFKNDLLLQVKNGLEDVKIYYTPYVGRGWYVNIEHKKDSLIGMGLFARNLSANLFPVKDHPDKVKGIKYASSSGFSVNYKENTYAGILSNYFKVEGNLGELEGKYKSFGYVETAPGFPLFIPYVPHGYGKRDYKQSNHNELTITKSKSSDGFDAKLVLATYTYNNNDKVAKVHFDEEKNFTIPKEYINNENIALVRYKNKDFIFMDTIASRKLFHPGTIAIKK